MSLLAIRRTATTIRVRPLVLAACALSVLLTPAAQAAPTLYSSPICTPAQTLDGSAFEGCDGNMTSILPKLDWTTLGQATPSVSPTVITDETASGGELLRFNQNAKEEKPSTWAWDTTHTVTGKSNILRAASANQTTTGNTFL